MKITDIRTHSLSVPYLEPPKVGFTALERIDLLIVEIETDAGVIGTGHLHPIAGGMRTLQTCIHEMLQPLLMGRDATDVSGLWRELWDATFIQGRMGITVMAQSAIDVALWDALGKQQGKPLWALWGGRPDPIRAYGSGCYRGLGHDGMIAKAERYVAQGFKAIKMQVAHTHTDDEDVVNVRDMREALGDDIDIMIDVNQGWSVDQALRVGARLEPFAPAWLEEPVIADDFAGYHAIAEALSIPIVGGENHFTHRDLKPFLESAALPILQPDVMRGGFTDMRVTAELAHRAGILMAPHLFPELMTHVLASIPNAAWLEYMGWFDHLWIEPVAVEAGHMSPPDRPGHGMVFQPELFDDYPYRD